MILLSSFRGLWRALELRVVAERELDRGRSSRRDSAAV
jgi:hypothetical protein